ncbi:Protein kinase domain protein [Kalmanozyma brasiliensis GHG001]|uniref:Protein kinase n=1 Tax=Kalmanozyma brasiliensis (strain GHG001) TaxID=1365824 RepID=V5ER65_KALBG|nr:Protein kinase domain protein [Kalmanozyma brasiliensis GHG001]EST05438.1 Protein kinase domain protein [Kalmanozyma brasiliensis GHG001]
MDQPSTMPSAMGEVTPVGTSANTPSGPPTFIEFALGGKRLVRYNRLARSGDMDAAVLGKGGFGCVYRYAIDASFTPPSSMDLSVSLNSAAGRRHASDLYTSRYSEPPELLTQSPSRLGSDSNPLLKPPSLVAVKLCRTPCSGSFDELQKTSLVDKKTRRADMQDDTKAHVRIVRGEGRIFQYLQAAHQASSRSDDPPLVKLLANLSAAGRQRDRQHKNMNSFDEDDGPPTRLLVFEKLIEIDAERTPHGWTKSKKTWTHERVEKVAFEVMQGLQFLHEHNVTHGDLKPSNLMLDPRSGVVKIIDLGASRRFVHLSNRERNNRSAVEDQDRQLLDRHRPVTRLAPELCEGLGSLTGSPYYMAPEILLQATRYVDVSGRARSVLEDYEYDYPTFLPREQWPMYQIGLSDLRRGWGIRADIWSWACTVQALLLKTVDEDQRPSSSTISPYDFSFSRHRDEMIDPLHEKSPGEDDVPRFHQWCRVLPLLIVRIALEPMTLTPQADGCTAVMRSALKGCLRHQDLRPTADEVLQILRTLRPASRASLIPTPISRPWSSTDFSPRPSNINNARHASSSVASSGHKASPHLQGHEFDQSRYATPPLSYGHSSIGTPQDTCETTERNRLEETPDRKQKGRQRTSTADSTFLPAPPSRESQLSIQVEASSNDAIPQGFELVSTSPTPKIPKARTTALGDRGRPATASATLQPWAASQQNAQPAHRVLLEGPQASRSHPSTPVTVGAGASRLCPEAGVRMAGDDRRRQDLPPSQTGMLQRGAAADASAYPAAQDGSGLGICWPLEGMHGLQLNSTGAPRSAPLGNTISVPSSPMAHNRGASLPLLQSTAEQRRGTSLTVPPPVALGSVRRTGGDDIGGSPRSSIADSKGVKPSSLMATLKKKQVRIKEGSKRLMGKRGSDDHAQTKANAFEYGYGQGHGHESEQDPAFGSGAFGHAGHHGDPMSLRTNTIRSYSTPATSTLPPLQTASPHGSMRYETFSSRRAANRPEDEPSPTKPLLRRLMTWGSTS